MRGDASWILAAFLVGVVIVGPARVAGDNSGGGVVIHDIAKWYLNYILLMQYLKASTLHLMQDMINIYIMTQSH